MADRNTERARQLLQRRGQTVPESDDDVREAAYELLKDEDFLMAHMLRLNKERQDFTREDWQSILQLSGIDKVRGNIAAFVACLSNGLISD